MSVRAESARPALRAHWVSGRERAKTRAALIEVARLMVERDGEPALTLGAVADEAGLARATVYGFFAGRHELLDALDPSKPAPEHEIPDDEPEFQAEDAAIWTDTQPNLNEFLPEAAGPEDVGPEPEAEPAAEAAPEPVADDAPEPAAEAAPEPVVEPVPEPVTEATAEPSVEPAPEPVVDEAAIADAEPEPVADAVADPVVESAPVPEPVVEAAPEPALSVEPEQPRIETTAEEDLAAQDERRKLQAAHLEEIAKRLILPESAMKEGTDAVISRLDTRIKVLEKSISGLETKQGAAQAESERKLRLVTGEVGQLKTRADSADTKALQTVSELRLSIHKLETRIEALEGPVRGAISETLGWHEPEAPVVEPAVDAPVREEPVAEDTASEDGAAEEGLGAQAEEPKHAYLSQVRTLAREGARQAEERESLHEAERQTRRRNMMVAAGIAGACLVALGALYAFNPGSHGVSAAQSKPAPAGVAARHASLAPLDRLSALAEKGDARAQLLVGLKYLPGNEALAARWLAASAAKGNAVAENALGALYQNGKGVKSDLDQATRLYQAAAAKGNRHAMSNLAVLYAGADPRNTNLSDAALWFQRSAVLGYVDAQFNLAVLYERGDGVPQSALDAYKWYTIAARAGDAVARTRADAIETQLSAEELAAARKAVAEFRQAPLNLAANDVPKMDEVLR